MADSEALHIEVDPEGGQAILVVGATLSTSYVTRTLLEQTARNAGVAVDATVAARLAQVVQEFTAGPREMRATIAQAVQPIAGTDGRLDWAPGFDPAAKRELSADRATSVDHHSVKHFVRVRCGDVIGHIIAPTAGQDGCDVRGRVIKCKPGRVFTGRLCGKLMAGEGGKIIAGSEGVLIAEHNEIRIEPVLDIHGDVDFSQGNIDFEGAVRIRGEVRPQFAVRVRGDLVIDKLVESAIIECSGKLTCARGVTDKGHGKFEVGGDAEVGYLDGVTGRVGGDLTVRHEAINCQLEIAGMLRSENATVMGGRIKIGQGATLRDLGAPAGTPTVIRLTDRTPARERETAEQARLTQTVAKLTEEVKMLQSQARGGSPAIRERLTELMWELDEAKRRSDELKAAESAQRNLPTVRLKVERTLHAGVRLEVGADSYVAGHDLKGPMEIVVDPLTGATIRNPTGPVLPLASAFRSVAKAA